VVPREDLLAMKATARSADASYVGRIQARSSMYERSGVSPIRKGPDWTSSVMPETITAHSNAVLGLSARHFQAFCSCGWSSSIDRFEVVDLLRAMHAHAAATFPSYQ